MSRTPLKNSKNVDKPFKSPFESKINREKMINTNKTLKQDRDTSVQSPLSARNFEPKRILLLDENIKENKIRKKLNEENKTIDPLMPPDLKYSDLIALKKKIFTVRQDLNCLQSRVRCIKKNDPEELKKSIKRWKDACQNALEILCSEMSKREGTNSKISDILNMLGIPHNIVYYSENEDAFF